MHQHGHDDPHAQKLYDLIRSMKIAMMTTVDTDGTLHSRPMHSQKADEHGDLWFFTKIQSLKLTEISRDRAKIDALWSEPLRTWFPEGKDDPTIALIRVHPVRGEYWDSPSSTILHLYGYAKAAVTGESPKPEQEKVNLGG